MTWQVKASTHCNLRCRYCYEWDWLDDRRRLTLPQWQRILQAAADYRALAERQRGVAVGTHIVLHGGEPLLLPLAYLRSVFALQRAILGEDVVQGVQTNLTVLPPDLLDWLSHEQIVLGVSWDGTAGARLDRAGRPTDRRVFANLRRAAASGIPCGVTLVLGAHSRRLLPDAYDQLEALGAAWLNVVPLFLATTPATADALALPVDETHAALVSLFEHWINRGRRLPVQPILDCVWTVHDRRTRRRRSPGSGTRFVVRPDGGLSAQAGIAGNTVAIGNLFAQSIGDILASDCYAAELARADRLRQRHCATCRYQAACDAGPILRYPHDYAPGPCPLESRLCDHIDSYLSRTGSTALELLGWSSADLRFAPDLRATSVQKQYAAMQT